MVTRNFKQFVMLNFMDGVKGKNRNGDKCTIGLTKGSANTSLIGGYGSSAVSIRIGSGSTLPSFDDYWLESPLEITPSSVTCADNKTYENGSALFTAVFVNNTETEITVTESVLSKSASASQTETNYCAIAREVFDPIVVPVGGSVTITMTIS